MKPVRAVALTILLAAAPIAAEAPAVETPLAPGVGYLRQVRPGPVVVHIIKAALDQPGLRIDTALAGRRVLELEPLSEIVAAASGTVAAAIDGGFALAGDDPYRGAPVGLLIAGGELICDPWPTPRSAVCFVADGPPRIELVGLRGTAGGAGGAAQRLDGLNRRRLPGELVLYTSRFHSATRQVEAGQQVVLSGVFAEGEFLRPNADYQGTVEAMVDGRVNVEIPSHGVVLAGSGPAEAWLKARTLGETVRFRFELTPALGEVTAAVGAGPRLVRGGQVSIEAEQEQLGVIAATGRQPRSAIGFNDRDLYLVAVDGRAAGYSAGVDCQELAQVLVDLGCSEAMSLDSGGATTLFARDRIISRPSDGRERGLSNAILIFTTGPLTTAPLPESPVVASGPAPPIAPAEPTGGRLLVTPPELNLVEGASVELVITSADAEGVEQPVAIGAVEFGVEPAELGTVDATGRFSATRAGTGTLTARHAGRTQSVPVRIQRRGGGLLPDIPDVPPVTPPGGTTVEPTGPTVTEPPDEPTEPSEPEVENPAVDPPSAGIPWVKPELPEGERRLIDGFESDLHWRRRVFPRDLSGNVSTVLEPKLQGSASVKLRYDFTGTQATRAVYALFTDNAGGPVSIGWARAVSVWVFGDGSRNWLRGSFLDGEGNEHVVTLAPELDWDHYWARCSVVIGPEVPRPITWKSIYLVQHRPEVQNSGAIYLDQLEGIY